MILKRRSLLLCSIVLLSIVPAHGEQSSKGRLFNTSALVPGQSTGVFLLMSHPLPESSVIYMFSAWVVEARPFYFQLWRPSQNTERGYRLVAERRLDPRSSNRLHNFPLTEKPIFGYPGDLIGMKTRDRTLPVGYRVEPTIGAYVHHRQKSDINGRQQTVVFPETKFPFDFSCMIFYDNDIQRYVSSDNLKVKSFADPASFLSQLPDLPNGSGTLQYYGPDLSDHQPTILHDAHAVFILPATALPRGSVQVFLASFLSSDLVVFQIWRPFGRSGNIRRYLLVGQLSYTASVTPAALEIPANDAHIFTEHGDIIGVSFPEGKVSIAYKKLENIMEGGVYAQPLKNSGELHVGDVQEFQTNGYFHTFAVGVLIAEDNSTPSSSDAPQVTPGYSDSSNVTTAPLFNIASFLGASLTFEDGQVLGHDRLADDENLLIPSQPVNATYLLKDITIIRRGYISAFVINFVEEGIVDIQVWRPALYKWSNYPHFRLAQSVTVHVIDAHSGWRVINLTMPFDVIPGDMIGITHHQASSVIAVSQQQDLVYANMTNYSDVMPVNGVAFTGKLIAKFIVAAIFENAPDNLHEQSLRLESEEHWLESDHARMGMLVWLIVLSLLVIIALICSAYLLRRRRRVLYADNTYRRYYAHDCSSNHSDYTTRNSKLPRDPFDPIHNNLRNDTRDSYLGVHQNGIADEAWEDDTILAKQRRNQKRVGSYNINGTVTLSSPDGELSTHI